MESYTTMCRNNNNIIGKAEGPSWAKLFQYPNVESTRALGTKSFFQVNNTKKK